MPTPKNPLELIIRKLTTHAPLGEDDRNAILSLPFEYRTLDAGSYVVRDADRPVQCGVLLSGFADRHKILGNGARQIVAVHIPGEVLDLQNLFLDVADHNVQTLTRAEIAFVSRSKIQEIARSRPAVGHALMVRILVEASIFREWIGNVGRRDAKTRVAHLLCEFAIRLKAQGLEDEYGYELPMTQEELGDAVGLTPVHVNRTLKVLAAEGLIKRDRRTVSFPDWERMREVGDFNERYLHMQPQQAGLV